MYFYFDESGDFSLPSDPAEHRTAVVMGLAVCDTVHDQLLAEFETFVHSLDSSELSNGEPKGALLSESHLQDFCDMLASFRGMTLTPVTLDLSSLAEGRWAASQRRLQERLQGFSGKAIHQSMRDEMNMLARQYANLSSVQALRLYAVANCLRESLQLSILFLSTGQHRDSWNRIRIEIDRVQTRAGSREERVLWVLLRGWLVGWSLKQPLIFIEEEHTPDHPMIAACSTDEGFDLGKLFGHENPHWVSSADSRGVQIADIAVRIVGEATRDLDDRNGAASLYASLMRSSYYGYARGPGLFTPLAAMPSSVEAKYMLLREVMKRNEAPEKDQDT